MKKAILLFVLSIPLLVLAQFSGIGPLGGGYVECIYARDEVAFAGLNSQLWRTLDGNTWQQLTSTLPVVNMDPDCFAELGGYVYMGCGAGGRCYRSSDNGTTWSEFNANLPFISTSPSFVPEMMETSGDRLFFGGTNFGLTYINDGDSQWTFTEFTAGYVNALRCLGQDTVWVNFGGTTYYTHDNGDTFTQLPSEPLTGFGLAATDFIESNGRIIACTNGGGFNTVYYSDDYGTTWTLAQTGFAIGKGMRKIGNDIYALAHDGIYKSTDNGLNWSIVLSTGFNTGYCIDDWKTDELIFGVWGGLQEMQDITQPAASLTPAGNADAIGLVTVGSDLLSLTQNGIYSWNGSSWQMVGNAGSLDVTLNGIYVNGNNVYLCTSSGLYESTDGFYNFTQVATGTITDMIISGNNWITTNINVINISTDNGQTWAYATLNAAIPFGFVMRGLVAHDNLLFCEGASGYLISSDNGLTWDVYGVWGQANDFVSFDGAIWREVQTYDETTTMDIMKSTDGGVTWTTYLDGIANGSFYPPCYGLFTANGKLYTYGNIADAEGLFELSSASGSWTLLPNTGGLPAYGYPEYLKYHNGQFFITPYNNGVWKTGAVVQSINEGIHSSFDLYPNPARDVVTISSEKRLSQLAIYDASGRIVLLSNQRDFVANINVASLEPGMYILIVETEDQEKLSQQFVVR